MKKISPFVLLSLALPVATLSASAQVQRSSITSFDKNGNPVIQYTSPSEEDVNRDGSRSSITSFDKNGNPVIRYTSPPLNPSGIGYPQSIAGLLANQNLYGQSAPNPNPGYSHGYRYNGPVYVPYPVPYPVYGGYAAPEPAYTIPLGTPSFGVTPPNSLTVVPLTPGYSYPAYPYPAPAYPYGAYPYPAPAYGYNYGYGYGNGSYSSRSSNYGVSLGRGGLSVAIGGSNTTRQSTTSVRGW